MSNGFFRRPIDQRYDYPNLTNVEAYHKYLLIYKSSPNKWLMPNPDPVIKSYLISQYYKTGTYHKIRLRNLTRVYEERATGKDNILPWVNGVLTYDEYLTTVHWKIIASEVKEIADNKCQICESEEKPHHAHHISYEIKGIEFLPISNLKKMLCVCGSCHKKLHDIQEAGR